MDKDPRNIEFKAFSDKALRFARSKRIRPEIAEEFAQEYALAVLKGETKYLKFQWANFCRERLGGFGRKKKKIEYTLELDERDHIYEIDFDRNLEIRQLSEYIEKIDSKRHRIFLTLIFHGVPQNVIAEIFNVTEPRISQMYKSAVVELRRRFKELDHLKE